MTLLLDFYHQLDDIGEVIVIIHNSGEFLMKKIHAIALLLALAVAVGNVSAQDVGAELKKMGETNGKAYVGPLMAGWGAGMNSGWFHSADLHGVLGFDIQVKAMFAAIPDEDKTYMFQTPATIGPFTRGTDYPAEVKANTVVGATDPTPVMSGATEVMRIPGGLDLSGAPFFAPQISIGLPFGLEVMGRFLPTTKLGDAGKVNFTGFGLRHDVDQYIPLLPLDLAVHFATQKFNYEDGKGQKLISASGTAFGLVASKGLLFLTVYGGFQIESSSWDIGPYDAQIVTTAGTQTVTIPQFTIEGKNKSRVLVGVRLLLAVINVHADYSIASTPVLTAGIGITFR